MIAHPPDEKLVAELEAVKKLAKQLHLKINSVVKPQAKVSPRSISEEKATDDAKFRHLKVEMLQLVVDTMSEKESLRI